MGPFKSFTILRPLYKVVLVLFYFGIPDATAQTSTTEDLSFLIGSWEVTRTYGPDDEQPRILRGTLDCKMVMDDKFIQCRYEMERPGQIRGLDEVYFNYNEIYEHYESLWLSSTWPIKVLMQGQLENQDSTVLSSQAQFEIQDNLMEYVKGILTLNKQGTSFERRTLIRTSKDPEDQWRYHMLEVATRKE